MRIISRQKAIYFFLTLGVCLAALAGAVGSGWVILNWREGVKVFLGVIFFGAIVTGLVLNTIFLVREIRETLQRRGVEEAQRREFYEFMLLDTDRLLHTVEQVLKAGEAAQKKSPAQRLPVEFNSLVRECIELARARHHLH
ncbi:MAG: sensor histidine kinase, partial [Terriglobales bacterium]